MSEDINNKNIGKCMSTLLESMLSVSKLPKLLSLHNETLSLNKIIECKWAMGDYLLQM